MSASPSVLVFGASNSRNSINRRLALHAARVLKEEICPQVDINSVDLNDFEMPIFSADRENEGGIPQLAHDFFSHIGSADGLIISYAEHNGLYTAAFKNIFDWCSRIDGKVFQGKPMVALATSPGPGGAANVLKTALGSAGFFGADIKGSLSVGRFNEQFDTDADRINNTELEAQLKQTLQPLADALANN